MRPFVVVFRNVITVDCLSLLFRTYKSSAVHYRTRISGKDVFQNEKRKRIFEKMMSKQEARFRNAPVLPVRPVGRGSKGFKEPRIENNNDRGHRPFALSKFYMENISDLISSGALGEETQLMGFNITKVVMYPNSRMLFVGWIPSNRNEDVDAIQAHLNIIAPKLRYELIKQKNIGSAPEIRFGQDKSIGRLWELERILATADFGPDYNPFQPTSVLSRQAVIPTQENAPRMSNELLGPVDMTQNILNLNYTYLMSVVRMRPFKKSEKTKGPYGEFDLETEKAFYKYLRKRKFDRLYVERKTVPRQIHVSLQEDDTLETADEYIIEDEEKDYEE